MDCFWPDANLVVELDGYEFHRDRETFERDRAKAASQRLSGRNLIAFTHRQVSSEPGWVLSTVRRLLAAAQKA